MNQNKSKEAEGNVRKIWLPQELFVYLWYKKGKNNKGYEKF